MNPNIYAEFGIDDKPFQKERAAERVVEGKTMRLKKKLSKNRFSIVTDLMRTRKEKKGKKVSPSKLQSKISKSWPTGLVLHVNREKEKEITESDMSEVSFTEWNENFDADAELDSTRITTSSQQDQNRRRIQTEKIKVSFNEKCNKYYEDRHFKNDRGKMSYTKNEYNRLLEEYKRTIQQVMEEEGKQKLSFHIKDIEKEKLKDSDLCLRGYEKYYSGEADDQLQYMKKKKQYFAEILKIQDLFQQVVKRQQEEKHIKCSSNRKSKSSLDPHLGIALASRKHTKKDAFIAIQKAKRDAIIARKIYEQQISIRVQQRHD